MNKEMCRTCKFYCIENELTLGLRNDDKLHPDDYESECRRYPPVRGDKDYFGEMKKPDLLSDYYSGPIVNAKYWCGEYRSDES